MIRQVWIIIAAWAVISIGMCMDGCATPAECPVLDEAAILEQALERFEAYAERPEYMPTALEYVTAGDFGGRCSGPIPHGSTLLGCSWWDYGEQVWRVQIAECRPRGEMVDTLAHEYLHGMLWTTTGDGDAAHQHPAWGDVAALRVEAR